MNGQRPCFPEYGDGGDCAGARRSRHAFRFCIAACVLFATMLWFAEYFLRYDQAERLYLNAVTLEPSSARVMLQSAVKIDAETRESPTAKYMIALAERGEQDQILLTYEKAYKLDPNNSFLAIRYGCQLFFQDRFKEARERFREAGAQPPRNALPGYLEAAAAQWAPPVSEDLAESLALVARTNNSGDKVFFPRPSWPTGILPQDGVWYAKLRRQAVDESCAPLYRYVDFVVGRAKQDSTRGQIQYWDTWLRTIEEMGQRVMQSPDWGTIQSIAGIRIQLDALEQRRRIIELNGDTPHKELIDRVAHLRAALQRLNEWERARDACIHRDHERYVFPLKDLCGFSAAGLLACYALAYLAAKLARVGRNTWTVPHSLSARGVLIAGCLTLLAILCILAFLQRHGALQGNWKPWVGCVWAGVMAVMMGFGVLYPWLRLPRLQTTAAASAQDRETVLKTARKCRRAAAIALLRRYYGILGGLFVCSISAWAVIYRVWVSLYPWQVDLLTTGLAQEEAAVVREVLALLQQ